MASHSGEAIHMCLTGESGAAGPLPAAPGRTVLLVAGARPNFMKLAPLVRALAPHRTALRPLIVHTEQHYDAQMSDVFFDELGIPSPDFRLGVGSGSHAEQTARIMTAFESVCLETQPDLVVVVGDVNSTLACAIVAKKLHIDVAHVEAGLRSGDMRMPEEINRVVTDAVSDWYFVTEPSGVDNLCREGKPQARMHMVGHVMIDNLYFQLDRLRAGPVPEAAASLRARLGDRYGVVTLHRPSNVDDPTVLQGIVGALASIGRTLPLVFAAHPRTSASLARFGIELPASILMTPPLAYMAFLSLWSEAALVLTDSGGLQEETTALGVPCLTLRENTERPVTITQGTNVLVGTDPAAIEAGAARALCAPAAAKVRPALWDGHAAERIVEVLLRAYASPALA